MNQKILVTQSSMPHFDEYIEEIKDIWDSQWLTNMGTKHNELEKQLCTYLQVPFVSLFSNGHLALEVALEALELEGEVITTPFTFASTTHAIVRKGLTPIFCDVNPTDYTMDVSLIESLITEKTCAIVPVHVYGHICNVEEIERLAKKYDLKVIYDAAHAFGMKLNGKGSGDFGDVSMFSFHATKVFNTIEGGALTFNDEQYVKLFQTFKNFGLTGPDEISYVAGNAKMNEFQAAMGLCNLRHVDEEIAKRKLVAERYKEQLSGIAGIQIPSRQEGVQSNYAYFPVVFDGYKYTRDEVLERLKEHAIFARKYFYPLTNEFTCYEGKFDLGNTPVAAHIANCVLTLPLYANLSLEDVDRICRVIKS
ncbi:DegT/DnrJ/EryC1/StrS family aminotransferase [Metasolibacillus fluoroglycofenilyticus]|uniref:DegT/DnrJ/EryC1/StrS family aminotransferase n=1 Tax=Metasolibacillus fluoroglycofenilyticus TaxID=1239396 RepID=UPI000D33497D|nr:DegT/DnrJ/EryC1/StrS family aminotransferase [Metasolibacillus fluoroglycofenilyticus]